MGSSSLTGKSLQTHGSASRGSALVLMGSSWATPWTFSTTSMAIQGLVCLVAWDHLAPLVAEDLLAQWEEWVPMAGVAMEVVLDLHLEWVVSQEVMAWDMALLMALHMASLTMVLVLMASLKDMVNNLLPMANSPLSMVNN